MADDARKNKDRSPNFPFISLTTALIRVQEFYNQEKRGAAPFTIAASHWKYSPLSSGATQTVAALKSYGLMNDEGSGAQRKLRLSELALRILLDGRPDSTERKQFITQAALAPPIFSEVFEKWGGELPSTPSLHHYLVFDKKFNDQAARKVVEILKENQQYIGHYESPVESVPQEGNEDKEPVRMKAQLIDIPRSSSPASAPVHAAFVGKVERFLAPDVEVEIRFSGEPSALTYAFIQEYVALRMKFMKPQAPADKPKAHDEDAAPET